MNQIAAMCSIYYKVLWQVFAKKDTELMRIKPHLKHGFLECAHIINDIMSQDLRHLASGLFVFKNSSNLDLKTIFYKLYAGNYRSPIHFDSDIRLMMMGIKNTYGLKHDKYIRIKVIEKYFRPRLQKIVKEYREAEIFCNSKAYLPDSEYQRIYRQAVKNHIKHIDPKYLRRKMEFDYGFETEEATAKKLSLIALLKQPPPAAPPPPPSDFQFRLAVYKRKKLNRKRAANSTKELEMNAKPTADSVKKIENKNTAIITASQIVDRKSDNQNDNTKLVIFKVPSVPKRRKKIKLNAVAVTSQGA